MSIKAKTKKRLMILLVICLVSVLTFAWWGISRNQANLAEGERNLAEARLAVSEDRHAESLESFVKYLKRNKDDAEVIYEYAEAIMESPSVGANHYGAAMGQFRKVLELNPLHEKVREDLLNVYRLQGMQLETIGMADELLQTQPDNVDVLLAKGEALLKQTKYDEAKRIYTRLLDLEPDNLESHNNMMVIMRAMKNSNEEVVAYTQELVDQYPQDPRFEMLHALTFMLSKSDETSEQAKERVAQVNVWMKNAASRPMDDDKFVLILVNQLNKVGLYHDSLSLLQRRGVESKDDDLKMALVHRLWENRKYPEALELVQKVDLSRFGTHSELLAFKALALAQSNQSEGLDEIYLALENRAKDHEPFAMAWMGILNAVLRNDLDGKASMVEVAENALKILPRNPYFHYFRGQGLNKRGERELAIEAWLQSIQYAPAWYVPFVQLSQAYNATGRASLATEYAAKGYKREPNNAAALVALFKSKYQEITNGIDLITSPAKLLKLGETIQKARPGEPETFPFYLDLLVRDNQRTAAIEALQNALANEEFIIPEKDVIRVVAIARNHHLGLEDACFDYSEKHHGVTPDLVYAKALYLAATEPQQALGFVEKVRADPNAKGLKWDLLWARFLEAIGDDRAIEVWIQLANALPENVGLQQMAMNSASLQSAMKASSASSALEIARATHVKEFMALAIDRIKAKTSASSSTWRLAEAKLILRSNPTEQQAKKVVEDMLEVVARSRRLVEPRLLLSTALQMTGDPNGAMEQLRAIAMLQPKNHSIALEMAKLAAGQRDFDQARILLEQVLQLETATDAQMLTIATLYSQMGDHFDGIRLLEPLVLAAPDNTSANLLLAHMNIQTGQLNNASTIYKGLMQKPTPEAVQAYALFLGVIGDLNGAELVLSKLDDFDLKPGLKELIVANFYGRFPASEKAVEKYEEAIKLAPQAVGPRLSLINYYLSHVQIDNALTANEAARQAIPGHKVFELIHTQSEMVRKAGPSLILKPFIASMVMDATNRDAAVEVLTVMLEENNGGVLSKDLLSKIKPLADKYPRFKTLQTQLTDWYLKVNMLDDAVQLATRTMELYPTLSEPAEQLVRALAAQKEWVQVELVAQDWKERTLSNPIKANISMGEAMINLDRPKEALAIIDSYMPLALANPSRFPEVITLHCRASVASGDVDRAELVLKPLIAQASGWRTLWMSIAVFMIEDAQRSAAWLERVEPVLDPKAVVERVTLANDWFRIGQRFDNADYRQRGLNMLAEMVAPEDAKPELMVAYAVLTYAAAELVEGDEKEAALTIVEKEYRRSLASGLGGPQLSVVQNNLAILLADKGGDLGEALQLAKDALKVNPNHANFYDTVAHIHAAREEYDQAQTNLEKALTLQPESIEWRVGLADIHLINKNLDKAEILLFEIRNLRVGKDNLPSPLVARIDKLKQQLVVGRDDQARKIIE